MTTTLRIPDILGALSRFPSGLHRDEAEMTQVAVEWFASYDLVSAAKWSEFLNFRAGSFGAMAWPLGDKKSLRFGIEWLLLAHVYDDLFDSGSLMRDERAATETTTIFISAITDPDSFRPVPNLPIVTAFRDFIIRVRTESTPSMHKRFVDGLVRYTVATKDQALLRERHISPSIEEFVALRRDTGAIGVCCAITESSLQINVPDSVLQHPVIQALLTASNDIACWSNDVVSFNREHASGDDLNLVAVVCIEKKMPIQSAFEYVFLMIESAINRWFYARAQIPIFNDTETDEIVRKYVEGVEFMTSGIVRWYWESDRYFGPREGRQVIENSLVVKVPLLLDPQAAVLRANSLHKESDI